LRRAERKELQARQTSEWNKALDKGKVKKVKVKEESTESEKPTEHFRFPNKSPYNPFQDDEKRDNRDRGGSGRGGFGGRGRGGFGGRGRGH
jgi:hypothetical protein